MSLINFHVTLRFLGPFPLFWVRKTKSFLILGTQVDQIVGKRKQSSEPFFEEGKEPNVSLSMKKRKGSGFRARELEFSEVVVLLPPADHEVFAMHRILRFEGRFGVGDLGSINEDRVARGEGSGFALGSGRA